MKPTAVLGPLLGQPRSAISGRCSFERGRLCMQKFDTKGATEVMSIERSLRDGIQPAMLVLEGMAVDVVRK